MESEIEFQQVHDLFRTRIQRYLTRLVGAAEAEDLTQEVFTKVSRALETFRGESEMSTWLYRIATNAATDKIRTLAFQQAAHTDSLDEADELDDPTMYIGTEMLSLEQQAMQTERYECYERFVFSLPANYRTVVVLSDLEELTNEEIAEILGLSLDVVKIRLHRGRAKLLQELKTHCQAQDWL